MRQKHMMEERNHEARRSCRTCSLNCLNQEVAGQSRSVALHVPPVKLPIHGMAALTLNVDSPFGGLVADPSLQWCSSSVPSNASYYLTVTMVTKPDVSDYTQC